MQLLHCTRSTYCISSPRYSTSTCTVFAHRFFFPNLLCAHHLKSDFSLGAPRAVDRRLLELYCVLLHKIDGIYLLVYYCRHGATLTHSLVDTAEAYAYVYRYQTMRAIGNRGRVARYGVHRLGLWNRYAVLRMCTYVREPIHPVSGPKICAHILCLYGT